MLFQLVRGCVGGLCVRSSLIYMGCVKFGKVQVHFPLSCYSRNYLSSSVSHKNSFVGCKCPHEQHFPNQHKLSEKTRKKTSLETLGRSEKRNFWEKHTPLIINIFFPTAVFLTLHSHEQPCASALSAGLPAAGLLWPGCGLWPAGSFPRHAHPLLYGSRG